MSAPKFEFSFVGLYLAGLASLVGAAPSPAPSPSPSAPPPGDGLNKAFVAMFAFATSMCVLIAMCTFGARCKQEIRQIEKEQQSSHGSEGASTTSATLTTSV